MSNVCRICGNTNLISYKGDERVNQCPDCSTMLLSEQYVIKDLESYYNEFNSYSTSIADPENIALMEKTARGYMPVIARFSNPEADHASKETFLDIGANYGVLVDEAGKYSFEAFGLESNNFLVEQAAHKNIHLIHGTIESFEPPKKFDAVTMMHVLEHVPNPPAVIKKINSFIKPGGYFYVDVPNIESYLAQKDGVSWKYIAREHITYFSPATLTDLLEKNGFKVVYKKKDNPYLEQFTIKYLLHYYFGKSLVRDRFGMKKFERTKDEHPSKRSFIRKMIRKLLATGIRILGRGDFILIVAQKDL